MEKKILDPFVKKLISNMGWQSVGMFLRAVTSFVALGVIANIAGAETVGIYGVSWVFVFGAFSIIQGFCGQTLIGLKRAENGHVNACFFLSLLLPALIIIAALVVESLTSHISFNLELEAGIKLGIVLLPVMSLAVAENALLQRHLEFRLFALINTGCSVASALSAIAIAVFIDPLLALFCLTGLIGLAQFLMYRLLGKRLPFGRFTVKDLEDVWNSGKHFGLNALSGAIFINSPQLLIAMFISLEQVGIYVLCRRLIEMLVTQVSTVVYVVIFPSFATIRDDLDRVRSLFLRSNYYSALVMMLLLLLLGSSPSDFLSVYAGPEWRSGGRVLLLIIVMQVGLNFAVNVFPTFLALGNFSIAWKWNLALTFFQCILLLLFGTSDIEHAAFILAMSTLAMPLAVFAISKKLKFGFVSWLKNMLMISCLGIVVLLLSQLSISFLEGINIYSRILLLSAGSFIVYVIIFLSLKMHLRYQ